MKSVLILSSVTFLLIFGGIAALALQLGQASPAVADDPADVAVNERLLHDLAVERDRVQRERESLAGMQQSHAAREALMQQVHAQLLGVVEKIDSKQSALISEQNEAAASLAKMYGAMKPAKAAVILAAMDLEVTLAILREMKESQAAKVLMAMDAGMAARISTRLSRQGGA